MEKDRFIAYQHHRTLAQEHHAASYALTRETPTGTAESAGIGNTARFDAALENIKPFIPAYTGDRRDKLAKRTPAVPVKGEHQGIERTFNLWLVILSDLKGIQVTAEFPSPAPEFGKTFEYFESVNRRSCVSTEEQGRDWPDLDLVESSVNTYLEAARQLTLEQALELGFTQEMYEALQTQP